MLTTCLLQMLCINNFVPGKELLLRPVGSEVHGYITGAGIIERLATKDMEACLSDKRLVSYVVYLSFSRLASLEQHPIHFLMSSNTASLSMLYNVANALHLWHMTFFESCV